MRTEYISGLKKGQVLKKIIKMYKKTPQSLRDVMGLKLARFSQAIPLDAEIFEFKLGCVYLQL